MITSRVLPYIELKSNATSFNKYEVAKLLKYFEERPPLFENSEKEENSYFFKTDMNISKIPSSEVKKPEENFEPFANSLSNVRRSNTTIWHQKIGLEMFKTCTESTKVSSPVSDSVKFHVPLPIRGSAFQILPIKSKSPKKNFEESKHHEDTHKNTHKLYFSEPKTEI